MTASLIWQRARVFAPRLQLRDVWFVVRQFQARALVQCLNPATGNGKIYFWTERGLPAVKRAFGSIVKPLADNMNWNYLGKVARARVRRVVLDEIAKPSSRSAAGKSATEIRKNLLERSPMELSRTIRALDELSRLKLIRVNGWTPKPRRKLYQLTPAGHRVVETLKQAHTHHHATPGSAAEAIRDPIERSSRR